MEIDSWLINEMDTNMLCHLIHGYVSLVVSTSRSFPHSWLITGFITRLTRRVPLVEQELLTLPDHPSSSPVFNGVRVTRSLVLCVWFCRSLFVLLYFFCWPLYCLFFFDIRILITPLVSSNSSYISANWNRIFNLLNFSPLQLELKDFHSNPSNGLFSISAMHEKNNQAKFNQYTNIITFWKFLIINWMK